jgi:hypothetical protein
MSEFVRASQLDIIAAYQRLLAAIEHSNNAEDHDAAVEDLGHFLRMNGAGRIQEWFANRKETAS